jgi:hypothetical protein
MKRINRGNGDRASIEDTRSAMGSRRSWKKEWTERCVGILEGRDVVLLCCCIAMRRVVLFVLEGNFGTR